MPIIGYRKIDAFSKLTTSIKDGIWFAASLSKARHSGQKEFSVGKSFYSFTILVTLLSAPCSIQAEHESFARFFYAVSTIPKTKIDDISGEYELVSVSEKIGNFSFAITKTDQKINYNGVNFPLYRISEAWAKNTEPGRPLAGVIWIPDNTAPAGYQLGWIHQREDGTFEVEKSLILDTKDGNLSVGGDFEKTVLFRFEKK